LAVVSAIDTGAQDFLDSVWPGGALYLDEEESFKKALGGPAASLWWLLKPSFLSKARSYVKRFGLATDDVSDKKTQTMGGTFVVKNKQVVYVHQETTSFDNGDARELLAAVTGKDLSEVPDLTTPKQDEAVCEVRK